jgi:uncharacterized membrane protein HdeD (DUF308 family)
MRTAAMEGFAGGCIVMASLVAATFFLRFWRDTRDFFFFAFACAFYIDGVSRIFLFALSAHPNEGSRWIYLVRLLAFLLILAAIIRKNYGRGH